jgi:hypothetical protein
MSATNATAGLKTIDVEFAPVVNIDKCTPELQDVITEIDQIFGDAQVAGLTAFWRIGQLITRVKSEPEIYLTPEQRASHTDGASLIISVFAPVYTAEQLRGAVNFYEKYPTESEIHRLLSLRCPDRPRWRMTLSHVQLLSQVSDEETRSALEETCANEAYTARALAVELQEIRGKGPNTGRPHAAPKGLKQQIHDLLQHQKRFIARSEQIWLNDDVENVYDTLANTAPEKIDQNIRDCFTEICGNFTIISDLLSDHIATCNRLAHLLQPADDDASVTLKINSDIVR